jgi:hypothetical protein
VQTILLAILTLLSTSTASIRPVKWTVIGGSAARPLQMGRSTTIEVRADIANGWHIYSLSQKPGGPIPLRLKLSGAGDVSIRGVVKAPKPERTFDKNFGIETELYSGSPVFSLPIAVAARSSTGMRRFQIEARYQVCSDRLCLPPRTDKLDAAVDVRRSR